MSFFEYLKDHALPMTLLVLADLATCAIATICALQRDAVLLIGIVLLTALAIASAADYIQGRRFYRDIAALADQLDHPYQLASLLPHPRRVDHDAVYGALEAMGRVSANEVAEAQSKAKEQREYMEAWVHEVKTPLAAALLTAEHVPEPESRTLKSDIDRAERQVEQVLWYARSLAANKDCVVREHNLASIAGKACKANARLLIESGVSIKMEVDPELRVFTDEKQVAFILPQVLVNSVKYGAHSIRISAREEELRSLLEIEDDGLGIPSEDVPRVFDRGFTGTRGREVASSTGMGLYIAARLCDSLGIGLSLSSTEGAGTLVTLAFPRDGRRLDAAKSRL